MLTALDIQNKEFAKGIRGYSEEDVDAFLDQIIVDYQALVEKNEALTQQVKDLNDKLAEYKSTEGSVLKTLESAKGLLNDISVSAEKRAAMLIKNAEIEAEAKTHQADEELRNLKAEQESLKSSIANLKSRMKSMLEAELSRVDVLDKDILG